MQAFSFLFCFFCLLYFCFLILIKLQRNPPTCFLLHPELVSWIIFPARASCCQGFLSSSRVQMVPVLVCAFYLNGFGFAFAQSFFLIDNWQLLGTNLNLELSVPRSEISIWFPSYKSGRSFLSEGFGVMDMIIIKILPTGRFHLFHINWTALRPYWILHSDWLESGHYFLSSFIRFQLMHKLERFILVFF